MSIKETLRLSKITTFAISFLGVVGAIISIYAFFFQEKKTELTYEIIANTNVLDIRAEVSKLDVLYDQTSLKHRNENLRIISVRVINSGGENILNSFYDDNAPLGLQLSVGRIIENPEILESSNEYIKSHLRINMDSLGSVTFSKVILESKEYFVLKLLVLHPPGNSPEIRPIGKVAGIKLIRVLNALEVKEDKPFFKQVFYGDFFIQVVRALSYTIVVITLVVIIAFAGDKISDMRAKRHRQRLIREFKATKDYVYNKMDDAIFDRFEEEGGELLKRMSELTKDDRALSENYRKSVERLKKTRKRDTTDVSSVFERDLFYFGAHGERDWMIINKMIEDGIAIREKDGLIVNQPMKSTLDKLVAFLTQKGEFEKKSYITMTDVSTGLHSR
jgi:hypothetical protein